MNCPLCGAPVEQETACPECGTPLYPPEPESPAEERPRSHPGIFYDNLISAQETYEEEHRAPKPPRFSRGETGILTGALLFLVLIFGLLWYASRQYSPDATAISGNGGIYMDNRTFSIYYTSVYQSFLSQYGNSLPFDRSRSLRKQYYNLDTGYTWEQYFMDQAFPSAALTERLVADARASGFSLSESDQAALEDQWAAVTQTAEATGMTVQEYLSAMYGSVVTPEVYRAYLEDTALAQAYSQQLYLNYQFSDSEIEAYYREHSDNYPALVLSDIPNADIRHILYRPREDTPEARADALEAALADMETVKNAEDPEAAFAALACEISGDAGSREQGGILQDLAPGQISPAVSDWCFDPSGRTYGDISTAESDYGAHLLFFIGYRDNFQWKDQVLSDMRTDALRGYVQNLGTTLECHLTATAGAPQP